MRRRIRKEDEKGEYERRMRKENKKGESDNVTMYILARVLYQAF
jgi:hypothetical protein